MNCAGCQVARFSADEPAIDRPTAALPVGLTALLACRYAGSSWVRKVSHL